MQTAGGQNDKNTGKLDSGLTCFALLARFQGKAVEPEQVRRELGLSSAARIEDILLAAKRIELRAKSGNLELQRAAAGKKPCG